VRRIRITNRTRKDLALPKQDGGEIVVKARGVFPSDGFMDEEELLAENLWAAQDRRAISVEVESPALPKEE